MRIHKRFRLFRASAPALSSSREPIGRFRAPAGPFGAPVFSSAGFFFFREEVEEATEAVAVVEFAAPLSVSEVPVAAALRLLFVVLLVVASSS